MRFGVEHLQAGPAARLSRDSNSLFWHLAVIDPRIGPSETFEIVWAHYGMTTEALTDRLLTQ